MNRSKLVNNGNFNSIELNLSSHVEAVNPTRLGSQLDASIDSIDFIPKSPERSTKPSPAKSTKHRKNNLANPANNPVTIPHVSPRVVNADENESYERSELPRYTKAQANLAQTQTRSKKSSAIADQGVKKVRKNDSSDRRFDASLENLPKSIRNIAQTQKDHGIVLSSGNFKFQDQLLGYEIRKIMNYVLTVNLSVAETNQKWSFAISYLEEAEDLIKIWERQQKLFNKQNIHKLNLWILSNISIEFEDFLIISVDFKLEDFRKKIMRELALIIYSATVSIQKYIRGFRIRKAFKKIIKAIRLHNVNASKVNTRLFGDVTNMKQKISTQDLLAANGKALGPYRQNSVGALVLEGRRQNSNSNLQQISPGRLHNHNSNSNLSPNRINGQNSNSNLNGLNEDEANLLMQHRKVVYDPESGQYVYEHGVAGDNRENRDTAVTYIKHNNGRHAPMPSHGINSRQSNRSSATQKSNANVLPHKNGNIANNTKHISNHNSELPDATSNKASVTIRKDLAKVKSDITSALNIFQNQLESLHEIINTKQLERANGPKLSKADLQALEEYKKSDKIANYVSQMSNVNNVNVLKSELADVVAKLDNMENLYILQTENANEIERSAKIEIAKARLVADKVSERAAERVRSELTLSYEEKLKKLFNEENTRRINETTELKRLEEVQHMAREDTATRAYQNFLMYEYKLKQMKMEIQIREVIIEREKQNKAKISKTTKESTSEPPSMPSSKNSSSPSATVKTNTADSPDSINKGSSIKSDANPNSGRRSIIQGKTENGSPSMKEPSKPVNSPKPSGASPKLILSFSSLIKVLGFNKNDSIDSVDDTYSRPPITKDIARIRIGNFMKNLIILKRQGRFKDLKQLRLRKMLAIMDTNEKLNILVLGMKSAFETLSTELMSKCQECFMRLISKAEHETTQEFVMNIRLLVDMLDVFSTRVLVSSECIWLYIKYKFKMDVDGETLRLVLNSRMLEVLIRLMSDFRDDGKIIFSLTKIVFQIYTYAELAKNPVLRSDQLIDLLKTQLYIHKKVPGTVENITRIFHKLVTEFNSYQNKICTIEFCEELSGSIEENLSNERLIAWISKLIVALCQKSEGKVNSECQNLLSSAFYPVLYSQLVVQFKSKPKVLEQIIYAILAIIELNFPAKKRIQNAGILRKMVKLLDLNKNSPSIVICSIWGISNLVSRGRESMKEVNEEIKVALTILQDQSLHVDVSRHASRVLAEVYDDSLVSAFHSEVDSPPTTPAKLKSNN